MSSHSVKARARHPDPVTFAREQHQVNHILFELINHPQAGFTFALIAGEAVNAKDRKPLFTGHVSDDMPEQLHQLASRIEELQKKRLVEDGPPRSPAVK